MDAELEDTQAEFQQLDDKMARVSQVATRIGDRLRVRLRLLARVSTTSSVTCCASALQTVSETGCFARGTRRRCYPNAGERSFEHGTVCCVQTETLPCAAQTSEAVRARATDAMDIVQFLQEFSVGAADFSDLSELFSDDKRMAEAAVRELTGTAILRCSFAAAAAASQTALRRWPWHCSGTGVTISRVLPPQAKTVSTDAIPLCTS